MEEATVGRLARASMSVLSRGNLRKENSFFNSRVSENKPPEGPKQVGVASFAAMGLHFSESNSVRKIRFFILLESKNGKYFYEFSKNSKSIKLTFLGQKSSF